VSKDARVNWKDPRPPVWQGIVKGKLVTIYDWAAYEEAKRLYPDDVNQDKPNVVKAARTPFKKVKPQGRYNWITKLDEPLKGRVV
jgi:hypothetical protein